MTTDAYRIVYWSKDIKDRRSDNLCDGTLVSREVAKKYVKFLREQGHVLSGLDFIADADAAEVQMHDERVEKLMRTGTEEICPNCGTVWEDMESMLTCPCFDDSWIR